MRHRVSVIARCVMHVQDSLVMATSLCIRSTLRPTQVLVLHGMTRGLWNYYGPDQCLLLRGESSRLSEVPD